MNQIGEIQVNQFLRELFDEDRETRMHAIHQLGECGDELCLQELTEHLRFLSLERDALTHAIARLKVRLGLPGSEF